MDVHPIPCLLQYLALEYLPLSARLVRHHLSMACEMQFQATDDSRKRQNLDVLTGSLPATPVLQVGEASHPAN